MENTTQTNGEPKKEIVSIEKSVLDKLIKRVERVESAANKAGLAKFDSSQPQAKQKSVNLNVVEGKVVLSWNNMAKNIVEKNPKSGHWEEDQIIEVVYEDGEKDTMPYVVFVRRYTHISATILKEIKNYDKDLERMGETTFKVETEEGKKYEIGSKFVN